MKIKGVKKWFVEMLTPEQLTTGPDLRISRVGLSGR